MAKEDDLDLDIDGGDEKPKSGSKKMIIIIALVVVLLSVSAAATLVLTGVLGGDDEAVAEETDSKDKPAKGAEKKAKGKKKEPKAPLSYVPLDPPFVVNFSGDTDVRFLQITVEAGTRNPEVVEQIKEHRPAIRNNLVFLFKSQDPVALDTREGMEKLRQETLVAVQEVLKAETGEPGVENVYFTSFVMQ
ncbi:flagellar FliL protein [Thiogranum longum]|uniref:Flagellar protein FliL n=1 Tax=Thiogranum longum TaxID=1537524 RepID=A0A4R1HBQ4_9GAMM|nr:flagellar basal body-associated FliL family protein [Thiogranum longum]TCK18838.1 flagellar FliL protein [Thiogranum longum]